MLFPSKRDQSPISTANANPVRVEIPRKHPSRRTTGVHAESAANSAIRASRRSRRATMFNT